MVGESSLPIELLQIKQEAIDENLSGTVQDVSTEEFSSEVFRAANLFPKELESAGIEILESGHGGVLLIRNGHLYRRKSKSERYSTSCWTCTMASCPAAGTLYALSGIFKATTEQHNHPPRHDYIKEKRLISEVSFISYLISGGVGAIK